MRTPDAKDKVYVSPWSPSSVRSVKVATPLDAVTVVVPPRVPFEPLAMDATTDADEFVTVLP